MPDNGKIILLVSLFLSGFVIYKLCIPAGRRLKVSDIFYLGHVFGLSLLLFSLYAGIYFVVVFRRPSMAFSQTAWKTNIESRSVMIDDLLHSGRLDGKDQQAVTDLLGLPVRCYQDSCGLTLAYYAGFSGQAFAIDPEFLMLQLYHGRVKRCYMKEGVPYSQ